MWTVQGFSEGRRWDPMVSMAEWTLVPQERREGNEEGREDW